MKKLIAALALVALMAVPTFTMSASARVSPASSSFGSNGYYLPMNSQGEVFAADAGKGRTPTAMR
jgi:hypothetical protein